MGIKEIYENVREFITPDILKSVEFENFEKDTKDELTTEFGDEVDITNDFYNTSGHYNTSYLEDSNNNLNQLIIKYRKASFVSYVSKAIHEIVNEAVIQDTPNPVKLCFNEERIKSSSYNIQKSLQKKITDEFGHLLNIIDFDQKGNDFFKRWYIDGRLYTQIVVKPKRLQEGILKVKPISPLFLTKCRIESKDGKPDKKVYKYQDNSNNNNNNFINTSIEIPEELVIYTPSGLYDYNTDVSLSHLQPALKDISRLDVLEDHVLIYAITRAPERRIFQVEVGNLPPKKAKEKLQSIINQYKQDRVFDESTGTLGYKSKRPSMLEDFFVMRRNGEGTNIDSLGGGTALTEIKESLLYFANKSRSSLNVPISRMDDEFKDGNASVGSSADEISREELRFFNYISKLRRNFSSFLMELLKRQLVYKNIIKPEEWTEMSKMIYFEWESNLEFVKAKKLASLNEKVDLLRNLSEYEGVYYTREQIYRDVLNMNDDEIEQFEAKKVEEKKKYTDGGYAVEEE
jgi:Bacteriophage T4-like portal protein (Gp20)